MFASRPPRSGPAGGACRCPRLRHPRGRGPVARRVRGFTLFELAGVLVLVALVASLVVPALGRLQERLAVWSAREKVVALLSRARGEAPIRGGSAVEIRESPVRVLLRLGADTVAVLEGDDLSGVELTLSGSRRSATLRYDALGVGRIASRSVTFRRGEARARLMISSYGRVRRP